MHDIFTALSSYRSDQGQPICTDSYGYDIAKTDVCNGLDILVEESQPPTLPCDALSIDFGYTAIPIVAPTTVVPAATPTPGCPAATDPATDSCNPSPDAGADGGKHLDAKAD